MQKKHMMRVRCDDAQREKIERLVQQTGFSPSQVLRALVENAEPQTIIRSTPLNANSDVNIRQDPHVAVAA